MEFEDLTWYWVAGYAGDLLTAILVLLIALTIIGAFMGDKDD